MKKLTLVAAGLMLAGCATAPPKILVRHNFAGPEKSTKTMLQDSGQKDPSSKKELFHVWVRVCDVKADSSETECKDTKILENVVPGSVY